MGSILLDEIDGEIVDEVPGAILDSSMAPFNSEAVTNSTMFKNVASQKVVVYAWDNAAGTQKIGDAAQITA